MHVHENFFINDRFVIRISGDELLIRPARYSLLSIIIRISRGAIDKAFLQSLIETTSFELLRYDRQGREIHICHITKLYELFV
jgi:hypothetical protein